MLVRKLTTAIDVADRIGYGVEFGRAFVGTAHVVDVAVDLVGSLQPVSSPQMQAVDILRDQAKAVAQPLFQGDQRPVGGIGLGAITHCAAVQIPLPDLDRHALKRRVGGEILRVIDLGPDRPVALFTAKCRNPALGRDASAGERDDFSIRVAGSVE